MGLIELVRMPVAIHNLSSALEWVFPKLQHFRDLESGAYGGYFSVRDQFTGQIIFVSAIGCSMAERANADFLLCLENSARLFQNPDHVSSWQSGQPDQKQYAGAIRTVGGLISFAGLSREHQNEALMLAVGHKSGLLRLPDARHIARISGNGLFEVVFDYLHLNG